MSHAFHIIHPGLHFCIVARALDKPGEDPWHPRIPVCQKVLLSVGIQGWQGPSVGLSSARAAMQKLNRGCTLCEAWEIQNRKVAPAFGRAWGGPWHPRSLRKKTIAVECSSVEGAKVIVLYRVPGVPGTPPSPSQTQTLRFGFASQR